MLHNFCFVALVPNFLKHGDGTKPKNTISVYDTVFCTEMNNAICCWNVFYRDHDHHFFLTKIFFLFAISEDSKQDNSKSNWIFVWRLYFLSFVLSPLVELWLKLLAVVGGFIHYIFSLAVSGVIEYLWYGQTIMLQQTESHCHPHGGLMVWSLWPIYFVCNAGKLDSLFPDDSYIDMGEIDVGRKVAQQIPPGIFWRSQVFIDHPMYLKFNVSLSKDALVGIYGRRGLPPSHTQVGNIYMSLMLLQ